MIKFEGRMGLRCARLKNFLPIVLIALMVQIFAPIGACWAASIAASDPLAGAVICHGSGDPGAGQADQTNHRAHDGCCSVCSVLQTGAPVDVPQTSAAISLDRDPARVVVDRIHARPIRFPRRLARAGARPTLDFLTTRTPEVIGAATARAGWCSHSSRPRSRCQEYLMYLHRALGSASLLAFCSALSLMPSNATAQTALPAVTVDAPRVAPARPAARKPAARTSARTPQARPPSATPAPAVSQTVGITPSVARALLYQAPTGQTETTIDRSQFDNRPAVTVADVLRESPGISVKQGNGPRDIGISIRGSNARNGFGIRNLVIFEDGFPVTQPDGLSRSDLIDPRAYSAIDVIRGPSSALYGNYATGGALNFRTRPGRTIDGVEYGVDGGSFGYLTNYLTAGKKVGNFEYSLFTSDARGDGFIQNSWYNTQTVNFLGTLQATPDDRFTVKFINNNLDTRLPIRSSLNQFYQNPFQAGCEAAGVAGCGSVPLFINGFNGARSNVTAVQAGLGREDRRTIVGGRWEHDFDNTTTWRNQFVFDDRNISQPTGATSAIGDFPSYNYMSDVTKRGEIFGMESTDVFRRLVQHADRVERHTSTSCPAETPSSGCCRAIRSATPPTMGSGRARSSSSTPVLRRLPGSDGKPRS